MSKYIGRLFNIGIAKESSRGTAVAATYYLPYQTLTLDDEITVDKDATARGIIEDGAGQIVTMIQAKGSIEGRITDASIGLILMATMGIDTVGAVETGVKDHVFTVGETAQHPSLTITAVEPNSNAGGGYGYPLAMVDSLDLTAALNKHIMYKMGFEANQGATLSASASYTAENPLRPQDMTVKFATTLSGLSAGTTVKVKSVAINIKKNTIADMVLGSSAPVDRLNQQFSAEGSFEMFYQDRTFIDTYLIAGADIALQFAMVNTSVTIGAASSPSLTVRFAKTKLESIARKIDPNGIVSEMIKFTGFYSLGDSKMLDITLRNTVTTSY